MTMPIFFYLFSSHDVIRLENLKSMNIVNIRKIICKLLRSRIIKLFFAFFLLFRKQYTKKNLTIKTIKYKDEKKHTVFEKEYSFVNKRLYFSKKRLL